MDTLTPLHVSSHWSPGRGVAAPALLVRRAAEEGLEALVLADFENLSGQVEHHHRCRAAGIRPITGLALGGGTDGPPRLVLLARDRAGYRSLCRIVARRRGSAPEPVDADPVLDAAAESDGLVALSEDTGAIEAAIRAGFPPSWCRILLARPSASAGAEARVLRRARALGVAVAALPRLLLTRPADLPLLRLRRAIHVDRTVGGNDRSPVAAPVPSGPGACSFADLPEAVREARAIAAHCEPFEIGSGIEPLDPAAAAGADGGRALRVRADYALEAARRDGRCAGSAYRERLDRELAVVTRLGFAGWFLAVDAIGAHLRERGIEAVARGSAAGSLLVHLLGLGPVDPVASDLVFERFLHERRREPPDLDLDLPSAERDQVVAWVLARWPERSCMVAAHQRFRLRSAWRDGLKALGLAPAAVERLCRALPSDGEAPPEAWRDRVSRAVPERSRGLLPHVERLLGSPRHLSTHPGALVLTAFPVRDHLPVQVAPKGVPVTQYDGTSLDALGVVRLDLLGSRCLDVLRRSARLVSSGTACGPTGAIPLDNPATFRLLDAGDTVGCFQVETPATRAVLRRRSVTDLEGLTAALAAVRPAPAGAGEGPLYEEDVMRELAEAGRLDLGESDRVRSAIVRTDGEPEALARLGRRYVREAVSRGAERRRAELVWSRAAAFAAYAFSRAHASSHALLAYRSAWTRVHHPDAYACALLDHYGGGYPLRSLASEIRRWGVELGPPCVNRSVGPSTLEGHGRVLLGLDRLRRVSAGLRRRVVAERRRRAYRDLDDLVRRLEPNPRELEALVLSGACDRLPPLSPEVYPFVHEAAVAAYAGGGTTPFGRRAEARVIDPGPDVERYRSLVRIRNELRFLGVHLHAHPMAVLRPDARAAGCATAAELLAVPSDGGGYGRVRLAALLAATHRFRSASGETVRFLTLEDETGWMEARVVHPERGRPAPGGWTGGPYLVEGVLRERAERGLDVERIVPFHRRHTGGPVG